MLSPSMGVLGGGVSGERLTRWATPSLTKASRCSRDAGTEVPANRFSSTQEKPSGRFLSLLFCLCWFSACQRSISIPRRFKLQIWGYFLHTETRDTSLISLGSYLALNCDLYVRLWRQMSKVLDLSGGTWDWVLLWVWRRLYTLGAAVASQTFRDPVSQGFPDIVRTTLHGEHTITHTHIDETYSHRWSLVSVSSPWLDWREGFLWMIWIQMAQTESRTLSPKVARISLLLVVILLSWITSSDK